MADDDRDQDFDQDMADYDTFRDAEEREEREDPDPDWEREVYGEQGEPAGESDEPDPILESQAPLSPPPPPPEAPAAPAAEPTFVFSFEREDPEEEAAEEEAAGVAPPPPPARHLVGPKLLPVGGVHLLGGSPHAGKSTFLAQLLSQFCRTSPSSLLPQLEFAELAQEEVGVVFTDRPWAENSYWFSALNLTRVPHIALADSPEALAQLSRPVAPGQAAGVELLRFCLDALPKTVKLVVADVLTNAFVGNLFHAGVVHRHMVGIQHLLRERGLTLLGTCYGNKLHQGKTERYERAIDRVIGAAPFRGSASSILFLEAASENSKTDWQRLTWSSRFGEERTFAIARGSDGLFFERTDVVIESIVMTEEGPPVELPARGPRGPKPDAELLARVLSLIPPGGTLARTELAHRALKEGIAKTSAYRALKRLVKAGELIYDEEKATLTRPQAN